MDKKCQVSNVVLSDSFLTKLNFISEMLFNLLWNNKDSINITNPFEKEVKAGT